MNRSRRVACQVCRDRKVRCNGCQPCEGCRRSGEACVYSPISSLTKADLFHTIELLRGRVDSAEAQILKQEQLLKSSQSISGADFGDYSQFSFPIPPVAGPGDDFMSLDNHNIDASLVQLRNASETDFISSLPSPRASSRGDTIVFPVDTMMSIEETSNGTTAGSDSNGSQNSPSNTRASSCSPDSTPPQQLQKQQGQEQDQSGRGGSTQGQIPSLREIRAFNSRPSVDASLMAMTYPARQEDSQRIVGEFAAFCSSLFSLQAEITGVAGVVREYLAWVRASLAAGTADPGCAAVLEMLEGRVHELQEMAETRLRDAWATLLDALRRATADEQLCATMSAVEIEARQRVERTRCFFQKSYDVSMTLSKQLPEE